MRLKKLNVKKIVDLKNIKSLVSKKLTIDPSKIIENTKNKIGKYYINRKKDWEKEQKKKSSKENLKKKKNYKDKKNKFKKKRWSK